MAVMDRNEDATSGKDGTTIIRLIGESLKLLTTSLVRQSTRCG